MSEQPYDPYIPAGGQAGSSAARGDGNQRTAALQAVGSLIVLFSHFESDVARGGSPKERQLGRHQLSAQHGPSSTCLARLQACYYSLRTDRVVSVNSLLAVMGRMLGDTSDCRGPPGAGATNSGGALSFMPRTIWRNMHASWPLLDRLERTKSLVLSKPS